MLTSSFMPGPTPTPSVDATTWTSDSGSVAAASSQSHAPSEKRLASSAATWSARRVLPTPPTPVIVTRRVCVKRRGQRRELVRAADERRELQRQVPGHVIERTQRRELVG